MYRRQGATEASNPEPPTDLGQKRKAPRKTVIPSQGTGIRMTSQQKILLAILVLFQLNTNEKTLPTNSCGFCRTEPGIELPHTPMHPLHFTEADGMRSLLFVVPSRQVIFHFSPVEPGGTPMFPCWPGRAGSWSSIPCLVEAVSALKLPPGGCQWGPLRR